MDKYRPVNKQYSHWLQSQESSASHTGPPGTIYKDIIARFMRELDTANWLTISQTLLKVF